MTLTEHIQPLLDKRLPAALVAMLLTSVPALAEDHLEPSISLLGSGWDNSEYQGIVVSALSDAYKQDVILRVVHEQSFEYPEIVVGLRKVGADYHIFALHPKDWLWFFTAVGKTQVADAVKRGIKGYAEIPRDYHEVKIDRCDIAIQSDLGERIVQAWKLMLLGTAYYENPSEGADGDTYTFSMTLPHSKLEGTTWSPASGAAADLVGISQTMDTFCMKKSPKHLPDLSKQVNALLSLLEHDQPK